MGSIKKLVEKEVPGVYVRSLEIGDSIAAVCSREKMVVRGLGKLSAQLGIYPIRFLSIGFFQPCKSVRFKVGNSVVQHDKGSAYVALAVCIN